MAMLTRYIEAAMRHATCDVLEDDGTWYCEIPDCPGVWANEETRDAALAELRDVLEGWIALGLALGHQIPDIDGVSIVVENVA